MKIKNIMAVVLAGLVFLLAGAPAWAADDTDYGVYLPFSLSEATDPPNIHLMLDTAGVMAMPGGIDSRDRYQVAVDVIAGVRKPVLFGNKDKELFMPFYAICEQEKPEEDDTDYPNWVQWHQFCEPGLKLWVGDMVSAFSIDTDGKPNSTMVEIIRLKKLALGYSPSASGDYFMFIYRNDPIFDSDDVRAALTTLDAFYREKCNSVTTGVCLRNDVEYYLQLTDDTASVILADASEHSPYEVFTVIGFADFVPTQDLTYFEALIKYYTYYDDGIAVGASMPTWDVVPVFKQDIAYGATYTDPVDNELRTGKCYYLGSWGILADCYWPSSSPSAMHFVKISDYGATPLSDWMNNNRISFETWANNQATTVAAYCKVADYNVWIDGINLRLFGGRLVSDGILKKPIYAACDAGTGGEDVGSAVGVDTIQKNMVAKLATVTGPVAYAPDNFTGDLTEFTMIGATRIDDYLRPRLDLGAAGSFDFNDINLHDPWFGDFFVGLYYNQIFYVYPGIMDRYPDKNYGFSIYDTSLQCNDELVDGVAADDDFPEDDQPKCLGMDLIWNPPVWAEYDPTTTPAAQNQALQKRLREVPLKTGSNAPLGSYLHQFFRYFYNLNMEGFSSSPEYPHGDDTSNPSMFVPLPDANDLQGPKTMLHIIQGDPSYRNRCRRNFLIMIIGNDIGGVGEITHGPSNDEQQSLSYWIKRLSFGPPDDFFLNSPNKGWEAPWGASATEPGGVAAASSLNQDEKYYEDTKEDITNYRKNNYPYRFCENKICTTNPWGLRLFWIFYSEKLNKGAMENAYYNALSSFDELDAINDEDLASIYDSNSVLSPVLDMTVKDTWSTWLAKVEGRDKFIGNGYPFGVGNDEELNAAFDRIMKIIDEGTYARTAPEVSVGEAAITTSYFVVDPDSLLYKGHLISYDLNPTVVDNVPVYLPLWTPDDAGEIISAMDPDEREIWAAPVDGSGLATHKKISALTCADLEGEVGGLFDCNVALDLNTVFPNTIGIIMNDDAFKFFDNSTPTWALGGLFHSKPRIVPSVPSSSLYRNLPGYSTFSTAVADKNRPALVYAGTMMGMLHAISLDGDVDTGFEKGAEAFSYIPNALLPEMYKLYKGTPMYGLDGTPVYSDLYFPNISGSDYAEKYRTVLVFGLGGGGQAYYGLDVTDVNLDAVWTRASKVKTLWEFKDANLAFTWSVPALAYSNDGDISNATDLNKKWYGSPAMFFGGGLQSALKVQTFETPAYGPDNRLGGFFYVVNVEDGSTIRKFELFDVTEMGDKVNDMSGHDPTANKDNHNMAPGSPIVLDVDNNFTQDWGYIGDYQGRVWKFNMKNPDPDLWTHCLFYDMADQDGNGLLEEGSGDLTVDERQPVWYTPALAGGPNGETLVFFGTGDIELKKDGAEENELRPNYYYAVIDQDSEDSLDSCTYGKLITEIDGVATNWPIKFDTGEKVITTPIVTQKTLYFKTWLPSSQVACSIGETRLYKLNYLTGESVITDNGAIVPYEPSTSLSAMTLLGNKLLEISTEEGFEGTLIVTPLEFKGAMPMSWGEGIVF